MISIMQPKGSWVARWNNKTGCVPGIYAMTVEILDNPEEDDYYERRNNDDYEDDENDDFLEQRKK